MHETVPANRRVYMVVQQGSGGMTQMRLSLTPPSFRDPAAVFILRGILPLGDDITLNMVSDPSADPQLTGPAGQSAYQVARSLGYGGTATQWLATLHGADGKDGKNGRDAAALLGTLAITQTATVALSAGVRRVPVTVPTSMGLAAGDAIVVAPTKAIEGYAIHDAVVVSPTSINVGITAPLLAIGASFSIPAKLFRLTA